MHEGVCDDGAESETKESAQQCSMLVHAVLHRHKVQRHAPQHSKHQRAPNCKKLKFRVQFEMFILVYPIHADSVLPGPLMMKEFGQSIFPKPRSSSWRLHRAPRWLHQRPTGCKRRPDMPARAAVRGVSAMLVHSLSASSFGLDRKRLQNAEQMTPLAITLISASSSLCLLVVSMSYPSYPPGAPPASTSAPYNTHMPPPPHVYNPFTSSPSTSYTPQQPALYPPPQQAMYNAHVGQQRPVYHPQAFDVPPPPQPGYQGYSPPQQQQQGCGGCFPSRQASGSVHVPQRPAPPPPSMDV